MAYEYYQNISTIFILIEIVLLGVVNYSHSNKLSNFILNVSDIFWCFVMSFIIVGTIMFLDPLSCIVNWSIAFALLNLVRRNSSSISPLQDY